MSQTLNWSISRRRMLKTALAAAGCAFVHSGRSHASEPWTPSKEDGKLPRRSGAAGLSFLLGAGEPNHGPGSRPGAQRSEWRARSAPHGQHCRDGFWLDCAVHRRSARLPAACADCGAGENNACIGTSTTFPRCMASSTTSATSKPASAYRAWSFHPSILRCCCAAFSRQGHTLTTRRFSPWRTQIYERVDWPWMLNGGKTFSMGWHPEEGFLESRWKTLLRVDDDLPARHRIAHPSGVGTSTGTTFPGRLSITRDLTTSVATIRIFTHQYSQAWYRLSRQTRCLCRLF